MALFTGGIWTPNHCVPLLNNHPSHSSPVTSSNKNITPLSPEQSHHLNAMDFNVMDIDISMNFQV
jgi:hypothetical protein